MLDPLDCYELCVQSPRHVAAFLRGLHSNLPTTLAEDFCGTAAVSRRWVHDARRLAVPGDALATDLDPDTVRRANDASHADGSSNSLRLQLADVLLDTSTPSAADLVFVGNFSIGYIHDRPTLVRYLRRAKARLDAAQGGFGSGGHGAFVCDLYGGAGAFRLGGLERRHPGRGPEIIRYSWCHEAADPITAMVRNSISFRVELDGEVVQEWPRAFVYDWRLWGLAELREAMLEAGFKAVEVYKDVNIAPSHTPVATGSPDELPEDWIVLVAGRA